MPGLAFRGDGLAISNPAGWVLKAYASVVRAKLHLSAFVLSLVSLHLFLAGTTRHTKT